MPHCCVIGCKNRSENSPDLSFYRFPVAEKEKRRWLKAIRRLDFTPTTNARVCSWHFLHGKKAGPNRFTWNENKYFDFESPEKRRKTKTKRSLETGESPTESHDRLAVLASACRQVCGKEEKENFTVAPGKVQERNTNALSVLADVCVNEAKKNDVRYTILEIENDMLIHENKKLKTELDRKAKSFSFKEIEDVPRKIQYYTGLPDKATFEVVSDLLSRFSLQYHSTWVVANIQLRDQLLLCLMKLRLNVGHMDLAMRFNCSTATVTNIFVTVCNALYDILYVGMMDKIPSRLKNAENLPNCFSYFPHCRIVIDCTEFSVESSGKLEEQSTLYSNYKGKSTLKTLIGVAPNGVITFVSDAYGGSVSDKAITVQSSHG